MTAHNRVPLGDTENARLATLNVRILAALTAGQRTNAELSKISLDYGRRIRDLRSKGYWIEREKIDRGLNLYTLRPGKEPRWMVMARVTLADGTASLQSVEVAATNMGLAHNRAQHLFSVVKIVGSHAAP